MGRITSRPCESVSFALLREKSLPKDGEFPLDTLLGVFGVGNHPLLVLNAKFLPGLKVLVGKSQPSLYLIQSFL